MEKEDLEIVISRIDIEKLRSKETLRERLQELKRQSKLYDRGIADLIFDYTEKRIALSTITVRKWMVGTGIPALDKSELLEQMFRLPPATLTCFYDSDTGKYASNQNSHNIKQNFSV